METEQLVDVGQNQVLTRVRGTGTPLVLCHGTPFSMEVWDPVVTWLPDHRIHRWDMPGYGGSSVFEGQSVDLNSQAQVLRALIEDHWQLDRPIVVAHDIGGAVALRAHLVHGVEYAGLVLVDAVCVQPWGSPFYRLAQEHAAVFASLPQAMHRAILNTYLADAAASPPDEDTLEAIMAPWLAEGGQGAFYRQIEQVTRAHTDDIAATLDRMRCPTRVAWGADDVWLPISNGRKLAAALGTEITEIAGAGHLVQHDKPERLADIIGEFSGAVSQGLSS